MYALRFDISVRGDRSEALDKRDDIINLLEDNGYECELMIDGVTVIMSQKEWRR